MMDLLEKILWPCSKLVAYLHSEKEPMFLLDHGCGGDSTIGLFSRFRGGFNDEPPLDVVFFVRGGIAICGKLRV